MTRRSKLIAAAVVALLALAGTGVAVASGGDDDATDTPITGTALDQAKQAALAETGGGKVVGTEVGDEEGYYEVEVRTDDGDVVDVHLDKSFHVIGSPSDSAEDGTEDN